MQSIVLLFDVNKTEVNKEMLPRYLYRPSGRVVSRRCASDRPLSSVELDLYRYRVLSGKSEEVVESDVEDRACAKFQSLSQYQSSDTRLKMLQNDVPSPRILHLA